MPNWVSFFDFRLTLMKSAWFLSDLDKLIEAVVLSGAVPVIADEYRRIEQFVTPDSRIDVLRERVTIPIGREPSPLGPLSPGLTQFKHFDRVLVDEAKALAWLRENFSDDAREPQRKPGPASKFEQPEKPRDKELAMKHKVTDRTIRRWRAKGHDVS